ncbi:MAG TPA: helix-turn-helix domain-containing protein [Chthoniobacterales bacterium]|nr:helix-turn-helix domain-containing protein [Chthoniobacterales bacterium]
MPRTKFPRALPLLPSQRGVKLPHRARNGDWLQVLRRLANAARGTNSKPFYSMREVAHHFHLPLSRVSRLYKELEKEGVVRRIRGSRTILQGKSPVRHLIVRSVVGIPASLSCFLTLQDYRMFLLKVRREFRRRGLITAIAFYEDRFDAEDLVERLQQARADIALWYLPDGTARSLAPQLLDVGIPLLGISDGGLPGVPCCYEVNRSQAIRAIFRDWMASGISNVRIVRTESRSSADEERLEALLLDTPFRWRFVNAQSKVAEQFVVNLTAQKDEAIVFLGSAASLCLMRAPEAMSRILSQGRVGLVEGPVSMPLTPRIDGPVDLVVVNWQRLAQRIADDILGRETFDCHQPVIFDAKGELKVPFHKFAQKL